MQMIGYRVFSSVIAHAEHDQVGQEPTYVWQVWDKGSPQPLLRTHYLVDDDSIQVLEFWVPISLQSLRRPVQRIVLALGAMPDPWAGLSCNHANIEGATLGGL